MPNFLKMGELKKNPALVWVIAFVIMSFVVRGVGGTNASSRFAALQAMADEHTFSIDNYTDWSEDWSPSPNGKKYSNKAPGPVLLGFPLFFVLDRISKLTPDRKYRGDGRVEHFFGPTFQGVFSFFMQVLPFALFTLFLGYKWGRDHARFRFFVIPFLFGNTAILFMNSYFGHGMAALFFALAFYNLIEKNYFYMGLAWGFSLLTDYGVAITLPFFIIAIYLDTHKFKSLLDFMKGGIAPGMLWVIYHVTTYGSPFLTPLQFPNPMFVHHDESAILGGMFKLLPNVSVIYELILGPSRGLLFTQPWVVALLIWAFLKKSEHSLNMKILFISFLAFICMNSTFWGWHAGLSAGPRYLSYFLLAIALILYTNYHEFGQRVRYLLGIAIIISVIFRAQVYATTVLAPVEPLWTWQWNSILEVDTKRSLIRLFLTYFFILVAWFVSDYQRRLSDK